jgi:hypothetical protein
MFRLLKSHKAKLNSTPHFFIKIDEIAKKSDE